MKLKIALFFMFALFATTTYAKTVDPITNITTDQAAKSEGPYSQGTLVDLQKGKLLFISGQIPNDKTGKLHDETIQTATRYTLNNIKAILKAAGSDWKYVVRMDVVMKDINEWDKMNEEYKKQFPNGIYPARQSVQAVIDERIRISCIAYVPNKE
ncbi:RidA family protein [soil metagenome]